VEAYKKMMEDWNGDGNSCSKFSSYYGGLYKVRCGGVVYSFFLLCGSYAPLRLAQYHTR
jgi:hypothetical protein